MLRPIFVLSYWRGVVCGCALNGFIAIMLVIAPFAAARVPAFLYHDTFLSIAEALFIRQTNPITFGTRSWLIGNAISLVPFLLSVLNAQRRREEEAYYLCRTGTLSAGSTRKNSTQNGPFPL
ncbi:MAG: hypothetical protein K8I29_01855 [Alphaproteobacteria bacterium]|uniref:Uncharacterized protein n=1 Tax=Candidatus Nitrobium versatile TaxID=2884831 RepID=A0A953J808_9BACT|nr:hypothetical protein [Candidatus Nitrobium versatile]